MKKLLLIALCAGIGITGMAQTKVISEKPEKQEIRHDIKVKRAHKKAETRDLTHLKFKKAEKQQEVVNAKRKEVHHDTKNLRAVGVKHPAHDAKKEIRQEKKEAHGG